MIKKITLIISIIITVLILVQNKPLKSYYKEKESDVYYYEDVEGVKVPVPNGFIVSGLNNVVSEGLVIIDNTGSETDGNQFVWVPCDSFDRTFYNIPVLAHDNYTMNFVDEKEYKALKESVKKYKGFYIARYESSKSGIYVDGVQIANSKKNKFPWVQIPYSGSMEDIYGYSHGSLRTAKYTYLNNKNVNSTLMYPEHYDNMIEWFLSFDDLKTADNQEITADDILTNSEKLGNFDDYLITTGSSDKYCIKNICDIVGNVGEVTTESYLASYHIHRGTSEIYNSSMVGRNNIEAYSIYYSSGFRMVLII